MSKKKMVVALIGQGVGPNIPTFGKETVAVVSGMKGGVVTLRVKDENRKPFDLRVISSDGEYELPGPATYMSAECDDADRTLIVSIVRD